MRNTHKTLSAAALACAALATQPALAGGWGVGNGDGMRLAFAKAREHAANVVQRLQARNLPASVPEDVRSWIAANQAALAGNIAATEHDWSQQTPRDACAETDIPPLNHPDLPVATKVRFVYAACEREIQNFDQAAQLLVHEAVHHFGIADETFADKVAIAVYDAWRSGATEWASLPGGGPAARYGHIAVETSKGILIQGGVVGTTGNTNTMLSITAGGALLAPGGGSWEAMGANGAPARYMAEAVAVGDKVVLWGGYTQHAQGELAWQNSGAVYDVATGTWEALGTPEGQAAELEATCGEEKSVQRLVKAGDELIVIGGATPGFRFTLQDRRAKPIAAAGAAHRLCGHTAVWTGDKVLVWGGRLANGASRSAQGSAYVPTADGAGRWEMLNMRGAQPVVREGHTAVWTGSKMIVFGGDLSLSNTSNRVGEIYSPETGWTGIDSELAVSRISHQAVWTGQEMLVYGGRNARQRGFKTVSAFNPSNGGWRFVDLGNLPEGRYQQSATWTGASMVVFGGRAVMGAPLGSGGIFYP